MQFTTIAATALLAATGTLGAPDYADHGKEMAYFTFQGAADAQFPLEVPVDNTFMEINNALSISHIAVTAADNVWCLAIGVDGSHTATHGSDSKDVGPPQTQVRVKCAHAPMH